MNTSSRSRLLTILTQSWWFIASLLLCCVTNAQVAEPDKEAESLFKAAGDALNEDQNDRVREIVQQIITLRPDSVRALQRSAELLYLSGHVKESIPIFDKVIQLDPAIEPSNWQRGIALATNGDFERGAEQFKLHHDVNPDDVENSAWYFLCIAKSKNVEAARQTVINSRGDSRKPMMDVLKMLQGHETPEQVLAAVANSNDQAKFFGKLYVGLYYDSIGRSDDAERYLKSSLEHRAAVYMKLTAKVYLEERFQKSKDSDRNGKP